MPKPIDLISSFFPLLIEGDAGSLLEIFVGEPDVDVPRPGRVRGLDRFTEFVAGSRDWFSQRRASVQHLSATLTSKRVVLESLIHMTQDGSPLALPVAVVGDIVGNEDDGRLSALRVYHSLWPVFGAHQVRPPLLPPDPGLELPDVIARYQGALADGDLETMTGLFEPDGYAREPSGGEYVYTGLEEIRKFYRALFAASGGIPLQHCTLTDDRVRCAVEYNVVRWGETELPPQAGVGVYERGRSGKLAAARIYDDVDPPQ